MSVTNINYSHLRNEVIEKSNQCSPENLNILKQQFAEKINSLRRLDNILTVSDLVKILEKRNLYNIEYLLQIITVLNHSQLVQHEGDRIVNEEIRVTESTIVNRDEIYDIICQEVGMRWRDFARGLGLNQARIEELEQTETLFSERLRKILQYYESSVRHRNWDWSPILSALTRCRRNDLRMQINELLNIDM